jgi:hypothetical protein
MVLSAGGAVGLTGVFIAQAGEFVASADAIAVTGFGSGLDGDERHAGEYYVFCRVSARERSERGAAGPRSNREIEKDQAKGAD